MARVARSGSHSPVCMQVFGAAVSTLVPARSSSLPFVLVHVACLLVFAVTPTWGAVAVCFALFWLRMFATTAGFHRYFSHRSYKTSRTFQFILALLGTLAVQKGVLWWAANHR